eukprot:Hpha_TRINITY_DN16022_c4_g2::TRINITY_DN16022_c4_g2_i1::g.118672::m.118672
MPLDRRGPGGGGGCRGSPRGAACVGQDLLLEELLPGEDGGLLRLHPLDLSEHRTPVPHHHHPSYRRRGHDGAHAGLRTRGVRDVTQITPQHPPSLRLGWGHGGGPLLLTDPLGLPRGEKVLRGLHDRYLSLGGDLGRRARRRKRGPGDFGFLLLLGLGPEGGPTRAPLLRVGPRRGGRGGPGGGEGAEAKEFLVGVPPWRGGRRSGRQAPLRLLVCSCVHGHELLELLPPGSELLFPHAVGGLAAGVWRDGEEFSLVGVLPEDREQTLVRRLPLRELDLLGTACHQLLVVFPLTLSFPPPPSSTPCTPGCCVHFHCGFAGSSSAHTSATATHGLVASFADSRGSQNSIKYRN